MTDGLSRRLDALEARMADVARTWDDIGARCARVREAFAADEQRRSYRQGYEALVRETSTPAFGRGLGDTLVGHAPQPATPVRETNAGASAKTFADEWGTGIFDASSGCSRKLTWEDAALMDGLERQARARRPQVSQSPAGKGLLGAMERAMGRPPVA